MNIVCNKWRDDFKKLLNPQNEQWFDDAFLFNKVNENSSLELLYQNDNLTYNSLLNDNITCEEIVIQISKLKCKKAQGPDGIKNEILKCEGIQDLLVNFLLKQN